MKVKRYLGCSYGLWWYFEDYWVKYKREDFFILNFRISFKRFGFFYKMNVEFGCVFEREIRINKFFFCWLSVWYC